MDIDGEAPDKEILDNNELPISAKKSAKNITLTIG